MGEQLDECCSTQLIDGDGAFNVAGLDTFAKAVKLGDCGLSYAVVSIMGPQSSGKSTLLNNLFRTNFREMEALRGRSQTTKGIWMANCVEIEPCTLVLDLEGTDGRERGEDDTAFEKQSALFALAVSDIVLINMWCHDIGREQAANKPLLKTVFQVMMRLFSPRKTTLLFVIRDKTQTPLENLEPVLREDIEKIWDNVSKPQAHKDTPLSKFFNVEVTALSSYEYRKELFKEEVASLRQRFYRSIAPGGIAGDRQGVVPASGFSFSAQQIWTVIKENKDLDLPAHKVMVATVRCEEISQEKFSLVAENEEWIELKEAVQSGPISGFGKKLGVILEKCLSEYDMEATYFDEGVRTAKRKTLEAKLLQLVQPAYQSMLGHLRSKTLDDFNVAFDKALDGGKGFAVAANDCTGAFMSVFDKRCEDAAIKLANWDPSKVCDKLRRDIEAHVTSVQVAKLSEITAEYEGKLNIALTEPLEELLDAASSETWPDIRILLQRETETALSGYSDALSGFHMDAKDVGQMLTSLGNYARSVVEKKARDECGKVSIRMKNRFTEMFSLDSNSIPRVWSEEKDIPEIRKLACSESLKLLSCMAVLRLDDDDSKSSTLFDPLASSSWKEVPASKTMITPVQCKSLWKQFEKEIALIVSEAQQTQVMVATIRCDEIAHEKFSLLAANEEWIEFEKAVQSGPVLGFGKKLGIMLEECLSEYDMEVIYFDEGLKTAKRQFLEAKLLQLVQPAYQSMLEHLRSKTLDDFKEAFGEALNGGEGFAVVARDCTQSFVSEFDKGYEDATIKQANWDSSKVRYKLLHDIEAHVTSVRVAKLSEITSDYEGKLNIALTEPLKVLLDAASSETWPAIRNLLLRETEAALSGYSDALSGFDMDAKEMGQTLTSLGNYARSVVEKKARDESGKVSIRMKDRFAEMFSHDSNSKLRDWSEEKDIPAIRKFACSGPLKLLSCMAVLRLDDDVDSIENTLFLALMDPTKSGANRRSTSFDPLVSSTWEEVDASKTLITPVQCKALWKQFEKEIEIIVSLAQKVQESEKRNNNNNQPSWRKVVRDVGRLIYGP